MERENNKIPRGINGERIHLEPTLIIAHDLSDAWFQSLKSIMENGHEYVNDRGSYVGIKRKELDHITVQILNPGVRPLTPFIPDGIPAPTSEDYIENYLGYLMTSEKKSNEQYTYGEFIEKQLFEVIRMYKEDGYNTNQACMAIGDAESIKLSDPPCLRQIDTRVRYGENGRQRLHFYVYFRSWDLWAGFPTNLGGLQRMKEFMASEIGVDDGDLIAMSKGLHLYEYAWNWARTLTGIDKIDKG